MADNNITKFLRAVLVQCQNFEDTVLALLLQRVIDNAVGAQLDLLGKLAGQARNGLEDVDYRRYIRARVAAHNSDGLISDVIKVVRLILKDEPSVETVPPVAETTDGWTGFSGGVVTLNVGPLAGPFAPVEMTITDDTNTRDGWKLVFRYSEGFSGDITVTEDIPGETIEIEIAGPPTAGPSARTVQKLIDGLAAFGLTMTTPSDATDQLKASAGANETWGDPAALDAPILLEGETIEHDGHTHIHAMNNGFATITVRLEENATSEDLATIIIDFLRFATAAGGVRIILESSSLDPDTWFEWDEEGKGWDDGFFVSAKD